MPHYLEISYSNEQSSGDLGDTLRDLAGKYAGKASASSAKGDRHSVEFMFPHFAQCSWFSADIQANHPTVKIERFS